MSGVDVWVRALTLSMALVEQIAADLGVEGQERHELGPGILPQLDDRRVLRAPGFGELQVGLCAQHWSAVPSLPDRRPV